MATKQDKAGGWTLLLMGVLVGGLGLMNDIGWVQLFGLLTSAGGAGLLLTSARASRRED